MNEIQGKIALVTGGSRGIGAASVRALAAHGADVAFTYRSDVDAAAGVVEQVKALGRRALAIRADGVDTDAVVAAVDETAATFGRLDILLNNAAVFRLGPIEELGAAELNETLAANVSAPYLASRAAAAHMVDGGRIITIGSNVAGRTIFPGFTLYTLSKAAVVGMTKGLARDLGPRGITVNVIQPGPTDTDLNPADGPNAEGVRGHTALGRFASTDEIARTVVYLAGPGGDYITGTAIEVDGGFNI
ncbi:SDR family NAD(P)-dependent oxidoreductase [Embleya sp. MST-111070]|uniref:SDR family NAD(P)-dependent oxidoreductase n=1 Tax=Embleya sp. MST-111070 TaxID=3398231 RepID=UPI003F731C89